MYSVITGTIVGEFGTFTAATIEIVLDIGIECYCIQLLLVCNDCNDCKNNGGVIAINILGVKFWNFNFSLLEYLFDSKIKLLNLVSL